MAPPANGADGRHEPDTLPTEKPDAAIDAGLRDLDHCTCRQDGREGWAAWHSVNRLASPPVDDEIC